MATKFTYLISISSLSFCCLITKAQPATMPNVVELPNITGYYCRNDTDCQLFPMHQCVDNTCVCLDGYEWNYQIGICYPMAADEARNFFLASLGVLAIVIIIIGTMATYDWWKRRNYVSI